MAPFVVNRTTELYLRNIIAFEDRHIPDQDPHFRDQDPHFVSHYLTMLDFLINTEKDVSILVDKGIIMNKMGDANAVVKMVKDLCKNLVAPGQNPKYVYVRKMLNGFYENPMNKYKAIFVHEYFNTPWKIASTVAAVLLLLLTLIQTVCSIVSL
ncbi:unnamed protein product [Lathyrus sativus]|nr:unnamed protein product [Lathyrus sativus]